MSNSLLHAVLRCYPLEAVEAICEKSNRAIAEELVITERTVEGHVTNILAKRGFRSRAQIAAWVAGRADPTA